MIDQISFYIDCNKPSLEKDIILLTAVKKQNVFITSNLTVLTVTV